MTGAAPSMWTAYFAAQHALRADYERRVDRVERKYAELPPTVDPMVSMTRLNTMIAEITALSDECEGKIAALAKPTAEGVTT